MIERCSKCNLPFRWPIEQQQNGTHFRCETELAEYYIERAQRLAQEDFEDDLIRRYGSEAKDLLALCGHNLIHDTEVCGKCRSQ